MNDSQFRPSFKQLDAYHSFNGSIRVPGSKSITNRVLLISAIANGTTRLHNLLRSDDTRYMGEALKRLGVKVDFSDDYTDAVVEGHGKPFDAGNFPVELYLGNAGTAMRSLTAALSLGWGKFILRGEERMGERPIRSVRGNISSQYLTALLICAPYCKTPLHIHVEGKLISAPYIELTLDVMKCFGVNVRHDDLTDFYVPQGVYQSPGDYYVEGDASSATYPLAAAAISGGEVKVLGISEDSIQGDIAFIDVLKRMGVDVTPSVEPSGEKCIICKGPKDRRLRSLGDFSAVEIPDAAMTLAVLALFADAPTTIRGIGSWRVKETDRIAAMVAELRKVGATVSSDMDSITIEPPKELQPATIETYNDHRMAMCFSLVSLGGVPIKILDPACVNKTYPHFFEDFGRLAQ